MTPTKGESIMAKEILIADSDKLVQEAFQKIFATTPIHPLFVDNDEEALLRGKLFKPDLIIGGKALCQAVRADEELKDIPFIILLDRFDSPSAQEQRHLRANGMISQPLNEDEILSVIEQLQEKDITTGSPKNLSESGFKEKSRYASGPADSGTSDGLSLDDFGDMEEEIIELVDVVEEPEERISIGDFAFQQKEALPEEVTSIEPWEPIEGGEERLEKEIPLSIEGKGADLKEIPLETKQEIRQEGTQEQELFEKIEFEEILQKMERLKPSIEKEWPSELEKTIPQTVSMPPPEAPDAGLDEFEKALKGEIKAEPTEGTRQPFPTEEPGLKPQEVQPPEDLATEEELQELTEEEFPEIFLEELTGELERLEEEELSEAEVDQAVEPEPIEVEEISQLMGEELPMEEQTVEQAIPLEELPPEVMFAQEEPLRVEEPAPQPIEAIEMPVPAVTPISKVSLEELPPSLVQLDRKIEEILTKEVQVMVQDFATRIIPEMTKHMLTLTVERIEAMVKGIVPDLAEKAIREEIERLQKGEKD